MTEKTLLLLILALFIMCIVIAHWFDRRIVKKIKKLEKYQIKKGILKRHFYSKKK
tara:strand:- start:1538 stop:1702 length:165 start_codon:yes stop_codon:yes gene_type:complete